MVVFGFLFFPEIISSGARFVFFFFQEESLVCAVLVF